MKKILAALFLVLMMVPVLAEGLAFQADMYRAKVNVNVRLSPKAGSTRIDHLVKGQNVNVKRNVAGWCEIEYKKYRHAYVDCSFLEAAGVQVNTEVEARQESKYQDYEGVAVDRNDGGNWTLGSKDAKVVIEEFGDMQCPFCGNYFKDTFPKIFSNYIAKGEVKYVYYNFPLSFHEEANAAASAALCAGDQDKYWQMHALILENQDDWSNAGNESNPFDTYAKGLNLDMAKFDSCLKTGKFDAQIKQDSDTAAKKNVMGTPTFYVNGEEVAGAQPYEAFSAAIDAALKK